MPTLKYFGAILLLSIIGTARAQQIYYSSNNSVFVSDLDGTGISLFWNNNNPRNLQIDQINGYLFYTGTDGLYRVDFPNRTNNTLIVDIPAMLAIGDFDVFEDNEAIYAPEVGEDDGIYEFDYFDVTSNDALPKLVFGGLPDIGRDIFVSTAIDNDDLIMFISNSNTDLIYSYSFSSGVHTAINTGPGQRPELIALDDANNQMYWVNTAAGNDIYRANYNGAGVELLVDNAPSSITGMAFYSNVGLYYTTSTQVFLYDVVTDGVTQLIGGSGIQDIAVDIDFTSPTLAGLTPADNEINVAVGITSLEIELNETVQESVTSASGTSRQVRLFRNGILSQTLDRSELMFNNTAVTIPVTGLSAGSYHVLIGSHVISNVSRLDYIGIAAEDVWNFTIPCTKPTVQVSNLTVSSIGTNQLTLDIANGNGDRTLVLAKAGSAVDVTPEDFTSYNPDASFGNGDELGIGNFVVASGTSNTITIQDLPNGVTHFAAFTYNSAENCYLTASPATLAGPDFSATIGSGPGLVSISSIAVDELAFQFDITAGTGDLLFNALNISRTNAAYIFEDLIATARIVDDLSNEHALSDGGSLLDAEIVFNNISTSTLGRVTSGSTKSYQLFITFKAPLPAGIDNELLGFSISISSSEVPFTLAANSGSAFSNGSSATSSFNVQVIPTEIRITQQPSNVVGQSTALPQQPVFTATDANGNIDEDFGDTFSVDTGSPDDILPTSLPSPANFNNGVADFTGSGFNFAGVGASTMTVTTTPSNLTSPQTNSITVNGVTPTLTVNSSDNTSCSLVNGSITIETVSPGQLTDYTFELFNDVPESAGMLSGGDNVFNGLIPGNYTVVATNTISTLSSAPAATTVNETLPVITASLNTNTNEVCMGSSVDLSVNITGGSAPYAVELSDGTIVDPYTSNDPITLTPSSDITYSLVSVTDSDGCSAVAASAVNITVISLPTIIATPQANSGCNPFNGELLLAVTGTGSSVNYQILDQDDREVDTRLGTTTENFIELAPGTYTINVTDNVSLCSNSTTATITDFSNSPTATAGNDVTICEGESVQLDGSAAGGDNTYTYVWDNGATLNDALSEDPIASPTVTTTYSLQVTDGAGCISNTATVTVNVNPQFQLIDLTSLETTICAGENAILKANISGGTGPYSIQLSDGTLIDNYTDGADIIVTPSSTTSYTITAATDNANCTPQTITGAVTSNVDEAPSAATVGSDAVTCTATFDNLGGNTPTIGSGIWTTTSSATINEPSNPTTGVSNLSIGENEFTWTITNGTCTNSNAATIIVTRAEPPAGPVSVSGPDVLCSDAQNITYTAQGTLTGITEYVWTLPNGFSAPTLTTTVPSITVNLENGQTGAVQLTYSNTCGSQVASELSVTIREAVQVTINVPDIIKPNQEASFSFSSNATLNTVNWNFGDGGNSRDNNPVHAYTTSGTFTVTLTYEDEQGCNGSIDQEVVVTPLATVSIKNAVTPNGDNMNDLLTINGIEDFPDNTVTLFDRWGVEVVQFRGYVNDWDMTINGDVIPAGNYICVVELPETGEVVKRTVTVVRGN